MSFWAERCPRFGRGHRVAPDNRRRLRPSYVLDLKRRRKTGTNWTPDEIVDLGRREVRTAVYGTSLGAQVQNETGSRQGTAGSDGSTTDTDSCRLEITDDESQTTIKVIQINARRSQRVMHEIEGLLSSRSIDVCLIQEPATDCKGIYLFDRRPYRVVASGVGPKSAILVANPAVGILSLQHLSTPHIAVAVFTVGNFRLVLISAYFQFSEPTQACVDALESVLDSVSGNVLVCADVNARSTFRHDRLSDDRGERTTS